MYVNSEFQKRIQVCIQGTFKAGMPVWEPKD